MQDPKAAAAELDRCIREFGFCGALVNDHLQGHYLDEPRYDEVWAALEELSVPLHLYPGAPPADRWKVPEGRPEILPVTAPDPGHLPADDQGRQHHAPTPVRSFGTRA
jgi:predicted TIM-barrel fold metal-dependent hydrolase